MKVIERVIQSAGEPGKNDLWLKEHADEVQMYAFYNGQWVPISGGCYCGNTYIDFPMVNNTEAKLYIAKQLAKAEEDGNIHNCIIRSPMGPGAVEEFRISSVIFPAGSGNFPFAVDIGNTSYTVAYTSEQYEILHDILQRSGESDLYMDEKGAVLGVKGGRLVVCDGKEMPGDSIWICNEDGYLYDVTLTEDIVLPTSIAEITVSGDSVHDLDGASVTLSNDDAQKLIGGLVYPRTVG